MRPEATGLVLSFVALLSIPCGIVALVWWVRRRFGRAPVPASDLFRDAALAAAITVAISLSICGVLKATGFFEAQFYRPTERDHGMQTRLGLEFESVAFQSADGTELRGWLLPSEEPALGTVIYLQGSDLNISYTVRHVAWLTEQGLNVFLFDYRGYGRSESTPHRRGLVEDAVAAIDFIRSRPDPSADRLVLYGQSMGGQLGLNAASLRPEAGLRLVIAEATYARPSFHLSDKMGRLGPLWLMKWGGWLLTSDNFSGESAIASFTSPPVLLIHGDADTGVAPYHSERLKAKAAGPVELWRYPGYGHLRIFDNDANHPRLIDHILRHLPAD